MARKWPWIIVGIVFLLAVTGVAGIGGYLALQGYRGQGALQNAEAAYAEERWGEAKQNYTWYLARQPGDPQVLRRYIDCCLRLVNNRSAQVRDAGRAYLQLALANRSDRTLLDEVMAFYRKYRLWRELDYATEIFLRDKPGDPDFTFLRALAMDRLGRTVPAIEAYQRLVGAGQARPEVYGNQALLLLEQGLGQQAGQLLDQALADHPEEAEIRVQRARFFLAQKDLSRASEEIDAAFAAGVETAEALLVAANVRRAGRDWQAAQALAEKAVAVDPSAAEGYLLIANSYVAERQTDKAIAFLSGIDPFVMADNPQLYLFLTELQINAGQLDEADQTMEAYRQAYPNEPYVLEYLVARRLLREGRTTDAISKLEVVAQQIPDLRAARYFLALAYLETGQRDRAKSTLELYLKSVPEDENARAVWEATFSKRPVQELEATALSLLDSEMPPFGALVSAAYSLGRADTEGKDSGEQRALAKRLYERAIDQSPSSPEAYRGLVSIYLDQQDVNNARRTLDRAKAADVEVSDLNFLEAALAIAEDQMDKARRFFDAERATGAMTPQRALRWAELFSERGSLEAGLDLLNTLIAGETDEDNAQQLALGRVTLCMRAGELERSLALVREIGDRYANTPAMLRRLNDQRMLLVQALFAENEDLAEGLLEEVERTEPDRTDTKIFRAHMLLAMDPPNLDAADRLCAAARRAGASDAELFLLSGDIAARKGQTAAALDYALQASAAAPNDVTMLMALAWAQVQAEHFTDAVGTLERVRSMQPENNAALELLGRAYAGAGRYREAEEVARQLEKAVGQWAAAPLRAWVLISRGEWSSAEWILRQLHEANPDDLWTIHFLTRAMVAQDQMADAVRLIDECIKRRPESPELWSELGHLRLAAGDAASLSQASSAFTQALIHQKGFLPALRGLLELQVRLGNLGGALGLCNRFLSENPDDPDMLERKAALLAQVPSTQYEALDAIQRAIEISARPEFFYLRGYLRVNLGDFPNAIEDFQRVMQAGGGASANLDVLLAEAHLGLNNTDLARFYYDAAVAKRSRGEPLDSARLDRLTVRFAEAAIR